MLEEGRRDKEARAKGGKVNGDGEARAPIRKPFCGQKGGHLRIDAIKAEADKNKSMFVMNADRIDNYLSQL